MRSAGIAVVALAAGALGGVLSSRALREARADAGGAIVVPVPPQGVVFRAVGGAAIARVRSDAAGGVIEVLDARERVALRLRATAAGGGAVDMGPPRAYDPRADAHADPHGLPPLPLLRSPDDPGY
jgi:hypothetical protein